jgi:PAS domain S-box-containing protein
MNRITREQWDMVFTHTSEAVIFVNENDLIESMNPAGEILTGHLLSECRGKSVYDVFKVEGISDFSLKDFVNKDPSEVKNKSYIELLLVQRSGEKVWTSCSFTNIQSEDSPLHVIFARNIDQFKKVEQMRSDFISIASHELRTPLTVIAGYLSLLIGGKVGKLNDKQLNFVKQIYEDTLSLASLVEDLLDVSRLDSGKFRLHKSAMSIDEVLRKTIESLNEKALERDITMSFVPDKQIPLFHGDRAKLKQVFTNIIDNAIKYTNPGGKVQIELKVDENSFIVIVRDNGYGIEEKDISHIFERFYRAENKLLDRVTGAGLGLYITKSIIDMHGGIIKVTSQFEKGTTFTITLPRDFEFERGNVSHKELKVTNTIQQFLSQFLHGK